MPGVANVAVAAVALLAFAQPKPTSCCPHAIGECRNNVPAVHYLRSIVAVDRKARATLVNAMQWKLEKRALLAKPETKLVSLQSQTTTTTNCTVL